MASDSRSFQKYMGLRQQYKRFKHFMAVITAIITVSQVLYPFAARAEMEARGMCNINESSDQLALESCELNYCSEPAQKKVQKTKSKEQSKTVRRAIFTPMEYDYAGKDASSTEQVKYHGRHSMTAYTSEVAQTDASPCTTANGFNVCKHGVEDTIAANFLPFGSRVKIPELFGDRVFIVRDRMNRRYDSRVDVWMKDKSDAMQFGVRSARIVVLK